jgi:hypothetical protein
MPEFDVALVVPGSSQGICQAFCHECTFAFGQGPVGTRTRP